MVENIDALFVRLRCASIGYFPGYPALTNAAEDIDMSKVRALAALPVKEIFRDSPVRELPRASYWKTIRESPIPVVVMFYSNVDSESQRLATLVRISRSNIRTRFPPIT